MFSVSLFSPLLLFFVEFLNSSVVEFSTAASAASGATDTQLAREIIETSRTSSSSLSSFSVSPPVKLTASQLVLLLSLPLVVFFVVAASLLAAVSTGTASISPVVMS